MKARTACSVAALAILAGACTSTATSLTSTAPPPPKVVVMNDRQAVAGCTAMPQIQAKSMWGGFAKTGSAHEAGVKNLKQQALAQGATHLVVVDDPNVATITGEPFKCAVATAAPQ
jgi:hypothetical protein